MPVIAVSMFVTRQLGHGDHQDMGTRAPGYSADGQKGENVTRYFPGLTDGTVAADFFGMCIVGLCESILVVSPLVVATYLDLVIFKPSHIGMACLVLSYGRGIVYYLGYAAFLGLDFPGKVWNYDDCKKSIFYVPKFIRIPTEMAELLQGLVYAAALMLLV